MNAAAGRQDARTCSALRTVTRSPYGTRACPNDLRYVLTSGVVDGIFWWVMKVLTIIATIFIPLSFVAGVYGMHFDYMPELHWKGGYLMSMLVMAAVAGGMLVYFRKKGWL